MPRLLSEGPGGVRCVRSVFQHAVCMDVSLLLSADIDECADGFVECDSKSTCVNLPGWYHCECRDGYHDNGLFSTNGESCVGEWPPTSKASKEKNESL